MVLERREIEGVACGGVCGSDREDATEDRLPCTNFLSAFQTNKNGERMMPLLKPY